MWETLAILLFIVIVIVIIIYESSSITYYSGGGFHVKPPSNTPKPKVAPAPQSKPKEQIKVFLIEEAWIDPMENRDAHGYNIYGYSLDEDEAIEFCKNGGSFKIEDCWSIIYDQINLIDGELPKFKYTELDLIPNKRLK